MARRTKLDSLVCRAVDAAAEPAARPRKPAAEDGGLSLSSADLALIREMIGLGELSRRIEKQYELLKAAAKRRTFAAFAAAFWARKSKPENRRIVIRTAEGEPDHDTLFQVKDQFRLGAFEDKTAVLEALTAAGPADGEPAAADQAPLSRAQASTLIAKELTSAPTFALRYTLSELAEGHTEQDASGSPQWVEATREEKAIAEKMLGFILAEPGRRKSVSVPGLTDREREILLVRDPRLRFRDAKRFGERLCGYCSSLAQLRRVLATFKPVQSFGSSHFAIGANEGERAGRLLAFVREILGIPGGG